MSAYYNEHDKFAAQWLRELIKAGLIADGEVDERDIQDVRADDLRGFIQCHFFAGIGGWSLALRLAGWPDTRPVWTGSCPCQPFSSAGLGLSARDPRHLWPAWFDLIGECSPPVIFGEQVSSADGRAWLDVVYNDLESAGYACGTLIAPAGAIGAVHYRERLWLVADASMQSRLHESDDSETPQRLFNHQTYWEANPWDAAEPKVYSIHDGFPTYVGLYHGFGNAIVPANAASFIQAYCEARGL